jgi:hypothetical protein
MFQSTNYTKSPGFRLPYFGINTSETRCFKSLVSRLSAGDQLTLAIKTGQTKAVKQLVSKDSYGYDQKSQQLLIQGTRNFTNKGRMRQSKQVSEEAKIEAELKQASAVGDIGQTKNLLSKFVPSLNASENKAEVTKARNNRNFFRTAKKNSRNAFSSLTGEQLGIFRQKTHIIKAHSTFDDGDMKAFEQSFKLIKNPQDFFASYDPDPTIADPKEGLYQCLSDNLIESPETFPEKCSTLSRVAYSKDPNSMLDVDIAREILKNAVRTHDHLEKPSSWITQAPQLDLPTRERQDSNQLALYRAGMDLAQNMSPKALSQLANGGLGKLVEDSAKVPFIGNMQQAIDRRSRQTQSRL